MQRVLLLTPTTSYRIGDFLRAAREFEVDVVVGTDRPLVIDQFSKGGTLNLDFSSLTRAVSKIVDHARRYPVHAVIGVDDDTTVLAAAAAKALDLSHNDPDAVGVARNKFRFRRALVQADLPSPWVECISLQDDFRSVAESIAYPCVLKPLALSASRGVIRADDPTAFCTAAARIAAILRRSSDHSSELTDSILIEGFIPGREVAVEGLLDGGDLKVLAMFDKPDPLDGPFFEETIYLTPSKLAPSQQQAIIHATTQATRAICLNTGPVHAELRVNTAGVWLIELAARSIGGRCSGALRFADDQRLETLILRQALGLPLPPVERQISQASGVMMIPIRQAGRLRGVDGLEAARTVPGVDGISIDAHVGDEIVPLPEGDRYLGFIFARGSDPDDVEAALREAHRRLRVQIDASPQEAPSGLPPAHPELAADR